MAFIKTTDGLINGRFVVLIHGHVDGYTVHYVYGDAVKQAEANGEAYFRFLDEMNERNSN